jgi:outer membrane beta-barrel protein
MTQRLVLTIVVAAGLLASAAVLPRAASAQEVQITGPLAGAPACRHCRIYRNGRFTIQPFVGFTLQDEYARTILFGAQLQFHVTDWLGIGIFGGYAPIALDTGLTDEVTAQGQTTSRNRLSLPSAAGFPDQIGRIQWVAAGQVSFIPLRGKLALFQKVFIDADFYVFLGGAAVGVEEREETDFATCSGDGCIDSQSARISRVAIAPTFGAGLTLFANDWISLAFEWRGIPCACNTCGTVESSADGDFPVDIIDGNDRIFHFNHMFVLGVGFYLPTAVRVGE